MKKLVFSIVCAGLIGIGSTQAMYDGGPSKKVKNTTEKGVHKTEKGVKHVGYDATHNKVTKDAHVNKGNNKYKNSNDVK